jgi:hypothetical protein
MFVKVLKWSDGNIRDNAPNQIRRLIGEYETVHTDDQAGTVRAADGTCYDWWYTDEVLPSGFRKVRVVPA